MAVVAVLGLLAAAGAWWVGEGRYTVMPAVVGMERASAEQALAGADLDATVTVARDDAVRAGLVAVADPAPRTRLPRGSAVRLTVSSGRPVVPPVSAGTAVATAERALRDAGLTPVRSGDGQQYSATVPVGTVLRTDPPAGTALPSGGSVTIVVSQGPPPLRQVRVPFLVGRTVPEATAELSAVGLQADVRSGLPFDRGDDARVVGQSHGAGSLVDRGTTVTLNAL